jgi:hypothetical protein
MNGMAGVDGTEMANSKSAIAKNGRWERGMGVWGALSRDEPQRNSNRLALSSGGWAIWTASVFGNREEYKVIVRGTDG